MTFLFQLVAVLIAGSVVALAWTRSGSAIAVARAIGVLAAAFAYVAFWGHFWQLGRSFWDQRQAWQLVSPEQADVAGAPTEPGFQAGFAEWIRGKLEPGETFYLVPSPTRDEAVYQWFTFRLLPNFASKTPEGANWLVFYGTSPRQSGFIHQIRGIAQQYGPGYSIARTGRAS